MLDDNSWETRLHFASKQISRALLKTLLLPAAPNCECNCFRGIMVSCETFPNWEEDKKEIIFQESSEIVQARFKNTLSFNGRSFQRFAI